MGVGIHIRWICECPRLTHPHSLSHSLTPQLPNSPYSPPSKSSKLKSPSSLYRSLVPSSPVLICPISPTSLASLPVLLPCPLVDRSSQSTSHDKRNAGVVLVHRYLLDHGWWLMSHQPISRTLPYCTCSQPCPGCGQ